MKPKHMAGLAALPAVIAQPAVIGAQPGSLKWKFQPGGEVNSSPAPSEKTARFAWAATITTCAQLQPKAPVTGERAAGPAIGKR